MRKAIFVLVMSVPVLLLAGCEDSLQFPELTTTTTTTSTSTTVAPVPGDVNGDGYADVLAGVSQAAGGGANRGQVYVYYGGPSMNGAADRVFTGLADGDQLGVSVALAGDVNGDGYADVIAGSRFADGGGTDRGQAYVYFGGPSMDSVADVILSGAADNDQFGAAVSGAGDVNGDGYADVIVGAYRADGGGTDRGQAYVFYGGLSMDSVADVTMTGGADEDFFGNRVSGAGDVNGDGCADVLVGAPLADGGGSNRGQAYIYFGGSSMDSVADVTMTGGADEDQLGRHLSGAGDVNGDGCADVILGAYFADGGGSNRGQAYIYYGGPSMDNAADVTMTGAADNDYLGCAVSAAGDVNGDGYTDVIVGAYGVDDGGTERGRASIFYGGPSMDNAADVTITGKADNDYLGDGVSSAGDVNGDGYADVIVGADGADGGGLDRGEAYVFLGGVFVDALADVTFAGAADNNYLGAAIAGVKP